MAKPGAIAKPELVAYARWMAMSDSERERNGWPVDNLSALARQLDVSRTWLYKWRSRPEFKQMVKAIADEEFDLGVARAKSTMLEMATREDAKTVKDREMVLRMAGEYKDEKTIRQEVSGTITHNARLMDEEELERAHIDELRRRPEFADKSDEELRAIAAAMTDVQVQQRASAPPGSDGDGDEAWRGAMDALPAPDLTLEPDDD